MISLTLEQATLLEEWLTSPTGELWLALVDERVEARLREMRKGDLEYHDYVRVAAAIRELEYLRSRPRQLITEARSRNGVHSRSS